MRKLVALTGAGVSAESGLATFRDAGGLWEGHKVEDVATPEAWRRNRELVLEFYNQRRKMALAAKPNEGHETLVAMEQEFDVTVITQNVDNLHERAGSTKVIHLHGNLFESRSSIEESLVYPIDGWELKIGDRCARGSQLRPNIVWFGELVPMMEAAASIVASCDVFVVVGTSLVVYPAAGLVDYVPLEAPIYVVDPKLPAISASRNHYYIPEKASTGIGKFREMVNA